MPSIKFVIIALLFFGIVQVPNVLGENVELANAVIISKYLKNNGLDSVLSVGKKGDLIISRGVLLTKDQLEALIHLHNIAADPSLAKSAQEKRVAALVGTPYNLIRYLVKYAISHEDVKLLSLLLSDAVSSGDGEYAEPFDEEVTFPLLLHFPHVNRYLTDSTMHLYADNIVNWIDVHSDPYEYDKGEMCIDGPYVECYKMDALFQILRKQSERLAYQTQVLYLGMLLVKNGKLSLSQYQKLVP